MSDWRPYATMQTLRLRAALLAGIRDYFNSQQVLEVETPVLSRAAVTDPNIESFHVGSDPTRLYLHTSPEFPMKRLLAAGSGDIYQVSRVFRQGEAGRVHNPEFSLLEWYRLGMDHHQLMADMQRLIEHVWPAHMAAPAFRKISYQQALTQLGAPPLAQLTVADIRRLLAEAGASWPQHMPEDLDPWLDLLMTQRVAPGFETDAFTFLYDYPASQAALAKVRRGDPPVAERFELYYGSLELANGFHELQDAAEQLHRFQQEQQMRRQQRQPVPPLDQHLIDALSAGLPACSGVALGIDRLMMVLTGSDCLQSILGFDINNA